MNNILLEKLPTDYEGYRVNTDFRVGIQINLLLDDEEISDFEKLLTLKYLLFANKDGSMRESPENIEGLITWFLNGWYYDKSTNNDNHIKVMDYNVDQGRIYADFRHVYGINISETNMHYWEFMWLLWNMPRKDSTFLQAIEIRTKKPSSNASREEIKAIKAGHAVFDLKQKSKEFSVDEKSKIDEVDKLRASMKRR